MAGNQDQNNQEKPGFIKRLSHDLGLEDDFVKDVGGDLIKAWVKEKTGFGGRNLNKSKFGRTVETLKSLWWLPGALIATVGIAVITVKILAKLAGV